IYDTAISLSLLDTEVKHRQLHILHRRRSFQQVEALKDESYLPVSNISPIVFGQARDILPFEEVPPFSWTVETTHDVHHGRFARSGRHHNSNEFASSSIQRYY